MKKTYAMFDVIGMKEAFSRGEAAEILERFWNAADAWVTSGDIDVGHVKVQDRNVTQESDPFVTTFSDTAILHHVPEIELSDFFKLVLSLKQRIDRATGDSYVIINRDNEVSASSIPAMGGVVTGSDNIQRYSNVAGSGPAFVNLFCADEAIKQALRKKTLSSEHRIYCVGNQSIPPGEVSKFKIDFTGHEKNKCSVHAIR